MKNIKFGFTLAEVAAALSIVGIVAALVLPMTAKSLQRQQVGITLNKAITQIETGNQNLIQYVNTQRDENDDMVGIYTDVFSGIEASEINNDLQGVRLSEVLPIAAITSFWGLNPTEVAVNTLPSVPNNLRGGEFYNFEKFAAGIAIVTANNDTFGLTRHTIYIDANGWNTRPNSVGVDIFAFDLQDRGKLVPSSRNVGAGRATRNFIEAGFKSAD